MKRRTFVLGATSAMLSVSSWRSAYSRGLTVESGAELNIPELMEVGAGAGNRLEAIQGENQFFSKQKTRALGFNQSYLGPVIRVKRGHNADLTVANRTGGLITAHWHGLHTEGVNDGGPQTAFGPGDSRSPSLNIDQPASTLWYHSHVHRLTGPQVYAGLAGMMIIDDPYAEASGLPDSYGIDDIPLIVQDRAFDEDAQLVYVSRGPTLMHGLRGGEILVNSVIRPKASVPKGVIRFRILNASNARIYTFAFEDGRRFHQVGTDGGLLARPAAMNSLVLAPAERAEVLVDFSDGKSVRLLSSQDFNDPMASGNRMGGMMARMMGVDFAGPETVDDDGRFEVMSFEVDQTKSAKVQTIPENIAGAPQEPDWGEPVRERRFNLEMSMGGMMGNRNPMSINGKSMDMSRIDTQVKLNETELWKVSSTDMAHPFHIHGTSFQVVSQNRQKVAFDQTGLKDVFLVQGEAEFLVRFRKKADSTTPFMYHCHILEHEDAGMMGQFTVS